MEAVIESSNGMSAGLDNLSSSSLAPSVSSENVPSVANERKFTQSELSEHIGRAKRDAVESYKRQQQQAQQRTQNDYSSPSSGESPQSWNSLRSEDQIRQIVAEESRRHREAAELEYQQRAEKQEAEALVQKFFSKVSSGKDKYQDFAAVTSGIDLRPFPWALKIMTDYVDNTTDVLYELSKDPRRLAQLEWLAEKSPDLAVKDAQRLSQSIKDNEAAKNIKLPGEPISQLRQTNVGLSSGEARSVSDFRAIFRKKGR